MFLQHIKQMNENFDLGLKKEKHDMHILTIRQY